MFCNEILNIIKKYEYETKIESSELHSREMIYADKENNGFILEINDETFRFIECDNCTIEVNLMIELLDLLIIKCELKLVED